MTMPGTLEALATTVLRLLVKMKDRGNGSGEVDGPTLAEITSLSPHDLNDAVSLLQRSGYVEWRQYLGTGPFVFGHVWATPVGRYEAERIEGVFAEPLNIAPANNPAKETDRGRISLPAAPIGSPYGFKDEDWEFIAEQRDHAGRLMVVLGYQFKSQHYDSSLLRANVCKMFERAVDSYNEQPGALSATLDFRPLAAGYGEHLFNEIARDIIASDIAVFDTSDLNPNVMLEMGVALTWGVRVLPIKLNTQPNPPSDISGQTWAHYAENGTNFLDPDHESKLVRMVERAIRKKGRSK